MTSVSGVLAQDPGPSPTASMGCEPHGDHWHCDGPASSAVFSVTSTANEIEVGATTIHTSPTLPSPTESVGCEPHGDHWHCDGPASSAASSVTSTANKVEVSTTITHASPTMPSPTESVGCEPHNDHWHCDGPAETTSASASASASVSTNSGDQEGSVGANGVQLFLLVGLSLLAASVNV
ncbi:hypothetical protein PENVUL_c017G05638 [Penicillium vulpinum]|uniref:Uncharacterized protein n=2 Tax=Penicillium vulpinum TaxID=29845 RepID=A0A1V6RY62_9EURO|nr:hypothetical protein PENVUL_c017G05638 [Penicillium vulpinum]